jgi:hypothetical protein
MAPSTEDGCEPLDWKCRREGRGLLRGLLWEAERLLLVLLLEESAAPLGCNVGVGMLVVMGATEAGVCASVTLPSSCMSITSRWLALSSLLLSSDAAVKDPAVSGTGVNRVT